MARVQVQARFNLPEGFDHTDEGSYIAGRHQLFRMLFMHYTLIYARAFPKIFRRLIEFILLLLALFSFLSLIYIHIVAVHSPVRCLEKYQKEWKVADILRVERLRKYENSGDYSLYDSYYKQHTMKLMYAGLRPCPRVHYPKNYESLDITDLLKCYSNVSNEEKRFLNKVAEEIHASFSMEPIGGLNIMEYSLEYGFLRLSPSMRKSLNLSVLFVALDPNNKKCFEGGFRKFILDYFLGYDEILLSSIKHLAKESNYKGYVRNIGKGTEYIFANDPGWIYSYIVAAIIMLVIAFSVSLLLRFAHQEMFMAYTNVFHLISYQGQRRLNFRPLFTVILALIGMIAIITSIFHNSTLTLNIIFIIWLADFYDSICCYARISRRHWCKFFVLYHYVFYAYNHRFNGRNWQLNLFTSFLFILHSMVFFYHHYELPDILNLALEDALENANQPVEPVVPHPDEDINDHEVLNSDNVLPISENLGDNRQQDQAESSSTQTESLPEDTPGDENCFSCDIDDKPFSDTLTLQRNNCFTETTENSLDEEVSIENIKCEASFSGSSKNRASLSNSSHSECQRNTDSEKKSRETDEDINDYDVPNPDDDVLPIPETLIENSRQDLAESSSTQIESLSEDTPGEEDCLKCDIDYKRCSDTLGLQHGNCFIQKTENSVDEEVSIEDIICEASFLGDSFHSEEKSGETVEDINDLDIPNPHVNVLPIPEAFVENLVYRSHQDEGGNSFFPNRVFSWKNPRY